MKHALMTILKPRTIIQVCIYYYDTLLQVDQDSRHPLLPVNLIYSPYSETKNFENLEVMLLLHSNLSC